MHTGLSVDDGIVIDKSRMNREVHVRFRESLRVKAPLATRLRGRGLLSPSYSIADSEALERDYGFTPKIGIRQGLRQFAEWYKGYYGV